MSSLGNEDQKVNTSDADNKKDLVFESSGIKDVDHSDLFVNVKGNEARERAEKREQEAHDKNLARKRKEFQGKLKNQEKAVIKDEKRKARKAWFKRNKKKMIIGASVVCVVALSVAGGFLANRISNPPLTEREQELVDYGNNTQRITENIFDDVFSKYDASKDDPAQIAQIYNEADEYMTKIDEKDLYHAYSVYAVFAKNQGDLNKMKSVLDKMEELERSDLDNYNYYNLLSIYYAESGDPGKSVEYDKKAQELAPKEEILW